MCEHMIVKASTHVINNAYEHTSTPAFKHPNTHTSYDPITLGFKHDRQSI